MADDASNLALAVTIFEALGVALGGVGTFVASSRKGRALVEHVASGVAIGALFGVLFGICIWVAGVISGA